MILLGLVGIGLTAGGFLTIQKRPIPWVLLGAASAVELSAIIVTATI